ncbi:MAG: beta-hydroxyacyl-ACP dehydratase [Thermoguttaceae bacterium]|nr:beta-hydroxyacyl-ACP dehydratase [Thermoguttaceae bacterium]
MAKSYLVDPSEYDLSRILHGIDEIHRMNMQRYEMEQLSAIVFEDESRGLCVGYKDLSPDEFWVRGHMPGMPLMPGVIMCEAAAQLCSYFANRYHLLSGGCVGFGGLRDVKFRGVVLPGQRFVVTSKLLKYRQDRMLIAAFQCLVNEEIVCEGELTGIRLPMDVLQKPTKQPAE